MNMEDLPMESTTTGSLNTSMPVLHTEETPCDSRSAGDSDALAVEGQPQSRPASRAASGSGLLPSLTASTSEILSSTLSRNQEFTNRKRQGKTLCQKLIEYLRKNKIVSKRDLFRHMRNNKEGIDLWRKIEATTQKQKTLDLALDAVLNDPLTMQPSWWDRMEQLYSTYVFKDPEVVALANYWEEVLQLNIIDPETFFQCAFEVFRADTVSDHDSTIEGKKMCLYLNGVASAGKSAFVKLFTCMYARSEIGTLGGQQVDGCFWMADLVGKTFYVGEEVRVTPQNVESVKMLFEGNANLKTQVKYGGHQYIDRHPIIVTTNVPIHYFVGNHANALCARCMGFAFTHSFNENKQPKLYLSNDMYCKLLCEFFYRYNKW